MGDWLKKLKVVIGVDDQSGAAFAQLGKKMGTLQGAASSLTGALTKLGIAGAAIFAGKKIFDYMDEGAKLAAEAQGAYGKFNVVFGQHAEEMDEWIANMRKDMPMATSQIRKMSADLQDLLVPMGLSKEKSTEMTQGFIDLANKVAAFNDVKPGEVIDALRSGLAGSAEPLRRFGINAMESSLQAKALEMGLIKAGESFMKLNPELRQQVRAQALLKQAIDNSADAINGFSEQTDGYMWKQAELEANMIEFQENLGILSLYVKTELTGAFNDFFDGNIEKSEEWAKTIIYDLILIQETASNISGKIKEPTSTIGKFLKDIFKPVIGPLDAFGLIKKGVENLPEAVGVNLEEVAKKAEEAYNALKGRGKRGTAPGEDPAKNINRLADDSEKAAGKIKKSFLEIAKQVVGAFDSERDAIIELRQEISKLDEETDNSLEKARERQRKELADMARASQERIDQIDKQIADERFSMSRGFRTRIAELESEKEREKNVIERIGGEITDISAEIAKDDLTILQEKHASEISEIREQAAKKREELSMEESERTAFLSEKAAQIGGPGFFDRAMAEKESFAGQIGKGAIEQSFVFNFNEVVAGDEGVKKIIEETMKVLNREATLRGVSGQ